MTFTIDKFLKPINPGDKNIIIYDDNGRAIHTINPYSVINAFVNNNLLRISLASDRVITLNFITSDLAKSALNTIQVRLEYYKNQNPNFIDKQVEKYVEDVIDNQKRVVDNIIQTANAKVNYVPRWISATALSATSSIWDSGVGNVKIGFTNSVGLNSEIGRGLFNVQSDLSLPASYSLARVYNLSTGNVGDYFNGTYGPSFSTVIIEGVAGGFTPGRRQNPPFGYPTSWLSDKQPLVRMSSTGSGTTLVVENKSPYLLSGQLQNLSNRSGFLVSGPSIVTHFKGPDPVFIWEQTDSSAKRLRLESTSGRWDFWSESYIPGVSNEISFQNSGGQTWELKVTATAAVGATSISHEFANYSVSSNGLFIISGQAYATYSFVPKNDTSDIITFSSVENLGVGMVITGRKRLPNGNSVDLFPFNTRISFIFPDNQTVKLTAPVTYTFSTSDILNFSGPISPSTRILGALQNSSGYYASSITNPVLRQVNRGEYIYLQQPKGSVYFGGGVGIGRSVWNSNLALDVKGLSRIDNLETYLFKLVPNRTRDDQVFTTGVTNSNNLLVGDIYGNAKWVPASSVVGNAFTGTSSTQLTIGTVGSYFQIKTQPYLSFRPGQVVVVYDELGPLYPDPNYQNGFGYNKILAEIDGYSFSGGTMSLVTLYSQNIGSSSNSWSIQLSGTLGPQGPAGFNQGTFSVTGDIIPAADYTYNLGSTNSRWNNIYVKDAIVASQSLYIGDVKISTEEKVVKVDDRAINKYDGTSRTDFAIGPVGSIIALKTDLYLSYIRGDSVKIQNIFKNYFEEVGYSEESIHGYFIGVVDIYEPTNGYMEVIVTFTENVGFYSDSWVLKLNSDTLGFENISSISLDGLRITGTSSDVISIPMIGHFRQINTQAKLGFKAGQEVIVYSELPNNYEDEDYLDDGNSYFIGRIDYYDYDTGHMSVVCDYSVGTYSQSDWIITLTSLNSPNNVNINPLENNLLLNGSGYDLIAVNFENISITSSIFDVASQIISLDSNENIQILANQDINILAGGVLNLVGHLNLQSFSQKVQDNITITSSTVNYDFYYSQIWNHDNLTSDYTANFVNLPTYDNTSIQARIIINQGPTAYMPLSLTIGGNSQTIYWKGGLSAGTVNSTDIIEFEFLRTGGTWSKVFGKIDNYV